MRDYIHVVDLARGHVAAIDYMQTHKGENVFNLGTGIGYSVLDMVHAFERVTGKKIPYEITARRPGDLATVYASPDKSGAARLEGAVQSRRHVPRHLGMADEESHGLRRIKPEYNIQRLAEVMQ